MKTSPDWYEDEIQRLQQDIHRLQHQPYTGPEIAKVIQLKGGSDSGGVYWSALKITNIYRTPDGLVIEVV